uniref:SSD domain-containing protein n=1 Tax=Caenorhabditis tropicalis TaxID=1561998 RepID=A0A1I7U6N6_9PELO
MLIVAKRSIPVTISTAISTFLSICILSFLSRLNHYFDPDPNYIVVILHVTTANSIFLRRCWDKYRRGPCSSTIVRLLLATVDKSLPMLLTTSTCASIVPLVSIIVSPARTIIPSVTLCLLNLLQNVCTMTVILSVILIRNTYNWCIPTVRLSFIRGIQAFVEEKLVYFAHLMCQIGQRLLSSPVKIPFVLSYLVVITGFVTMNVIRFVNFMNISIDKGTVECSFFRCYESVTLTLSLFIVPPVFFCTINKLQTNTFIALIGFSFTLVVFELLREFVFDGIHVEPIQHVVFSIIPADGALRFCNMYSMSRKKNHNAKVLDTVDTLFSQVTISSICSTSSLLYLFYYFNRSSITLLVVILLITNWVTVIFFYPSAIALIGPMVCGGKRRGSQISETRSMNTDRFSSHLLVDNPDYTKKYSTSNYYGPAKQKRSYNVLITDSRRASMPVSVQQIAISSSAAPILKKRSWANGACFSVDGVITMTPREALKLMRKEDSITSDNILIKELALI